LRRPFLWPGPFIGQIFLGGFNTFGLFLQTVYIGCLIGYTVDRFQDDSCGIESRYQSDLALKFDIHRFEDYNIQNLFECFPDRPFDDIRIEKTDDTYY